jgi:hypothetical protein
MRWWLQSAHRITDSNTNDVEKSEMARWMMMFTKSPNHPIDIHLYTKRDSEFTIHQDDVRFIRPNSITDYATEVAHNG